MVEKGMPPERDATQPMVQFRLRDYTVWVSAATVVLAASKVLLAATGDGPTMLFLVNTMDVPAMLISAIVPMLPIAALFGGPLFLAIAGDAHPRQRPYLATAVVIAVTLAVLGTPIVLLGFLVAWPLIWRMARGNLRGRKNSASGRSPYVLPTIMLLALLCSLFLRPVMWLPTESALIRGDERAHLVNVLRADDTQIVLLDRDLGIVRVIGPTDLSARMTCEERDVTDLGALSKDLYWYVGAALGPRTQFHSPQCPAGIS
jgi:hypothetical protein